MRELARSGAELQSAIRPSGYKRGIGVVDTAFKQIIGNSITELVHCSIAMKRDADGVLHEPVVVVDIGTGSGCSLEQLVRRAYRVFGLTRNNLIGLGIDLNPVPNMIPENVFTGSKWKVHNPVSSTANTQNTTTSKTLANFMQGEATALPLVSNSVDVLYSYQTVQYVRDGLRMLEEVYRVLREGGTANLEVGYNMLAFRPTFPDIIASTPGASQAFRYVRPEGNYHAAIICKKPPGCAFRGFPFVLTSILPLSEFLDGTDEDMVLVANNSFAGMYEKDESVMSAEAEMKY